MSRVGTARAKTAYVIRENPADGPIGLPFPSWLCDLWRRPRTHLVSRCRIVTEDIGAAGRALMRCPHTQEFWREKVGEAVTPLFKPVPLISRPVTGKLCGRHKLPKQSIAVNERNATHRRHFSNALNVRSQGGRYSGVYPAASLSPLLCHASVCPSASRRTAPAASAGWTRPAETTVRKSLPNSARRRDFNA